MIVQFFPFIYLMGEGRLYFPSFSLLFCAFIGSHFIHIPRGALRTYYLTVIVVAPFNRFPTGVFVIKLASVIVVPDEVIVIADALFKS